MNNAASGGRRPVLNCTCVFHKLLKCLPGFLTCNNEDEVHVYLTGSVSIKQDGVAGV